MKKLIAITLLFAIILMSFTSCAIFKKLTSKNILTTTQKNLTLSVLTIEGTTTVNTVTGVWNGVNISRSVPTTFIYRNNSITSVNTGGYMLQAGDESPLSTNNNLDGEVITGNKFIWNGVNDPTIITHGLFAGYNINSIVKYNYLDKVPYGIVFKSGTETGINMTVTSGGCAYNIWKNGKFAGRVKGINGVKFYNNTFYSGDGSGWYLLLITANMDRVVPAPSIGTKVFNNIFYSTIQIPMIKIESGCLTNFESDYNVYWCSAGEPTFNIDGTTLTWAQWKAHGYDTHSIVINPNFNNFTDFVPAVRLNYGTNLGTTWQTGLSTTATWVVNSSPATANQNGTWQVGARIYDVPVPPVNTSGNLTTDFGGNPIKNPPSIGAYEYYNLVPTITTIIISDILNTSATSGRSLTADGGSNVIASGVCWNTNGSPTISDSHTNESPVNLIGVNSSTSHITGLIQGTLYHVRAYATNATGIGYGNDLTFTTLGTGIIVIPMVTTTAVTNIAQTTVTSGGNITSDGGATVTVRGLCWATTINPTIANSKTIDGTGTGLYVSSITGLSLNTLYHVRAYATNNVGTSYGTDISFTTLPISAVLPTITTATVTSIGSTTATGGGNVIADGGANVTAYGVCYNLTSYPSLISPHTINGTGTGIFVSSITGLVPNITYHARAYATNSVGTAYGADVEFTTGVVIIVPSVLTSSVGSITISTAVTGGNVTSDGGSIVTVRGVCWALTPNPTTVNFITSDGSGTGLYISTLIGLIQNTAYHVRAYATNSIGTTYGTDIVFTTLVIPVIPTVTTTTITNIAQTTATSGGNVTLDGGAVVNDKGVCWSTNANPDINGLHLNGETGVGVFTSNITGLLPNTLYHVRAYATNSVGTAYGTDIVFTTLSNPIVLPTVTTTIITAITQATAISGGNVILDGGSAVISKGVCWAITSNPTTSNFTTNDGTGTGVYTSSITGLLPNTLYHIRAYVTNSVGTAYGTDITFTTLAVDTTIPTVFTLATTLIVKTTATSGGSVTSDGGSPVTVRGVCWNTTGSPTIANSIMSDGIGTGLFILNLTGLTKSTVYYIRAYATNSVGTAYGNILTFKTDDVPVLTTTPVYSIQQTTAKSGGNIITDDGFPVTVRGVCWSTSPNPISTNAHGTNGVGMGVYPINISNLLPNTTYYARAYAINTGGVGYGDEVVFTTLPSAVLATVTTSISETVVWTAEFGFGGISSIKLNCTGEITNTGNTPITAKGFCWGITVNPTVTANRYVYNSTLNIGTGIYTAFINSLSPNNTYHIRAFVKNKIGIAYGNDITVTIPVYTITGN